MASMVATAADARDEMDTHNAVLTPHKATDTKAKFMIRALPKDCNPTPASAPPQSAASTPKPRKQSTGFRTEAAAEILVLEATAEEEEDENPFDDINEEKLQTLTGKSDLSRVTSLQISVDANKHSVEAIGELLPSLQQLKLAPNSVLHSFRDLGTSLHSLQILWVAHCSITELDGIGALTGLQELHLQNNQVRDISPLTMHDELQVVDLEANLIADVGQIEQLAFCPQLASLSLRGNPLCRIAKYRQIVASFLPQLTELDGQLITDDEQIKLADDEIDAAIQALKEELVREEHAQAVESGRPPSSHGGRPVSSHGRRQDGSQGNASSTPHDGCGGGQDVYGSSLTHGSDVVFAGNVTSALRRHRSETEASDVSNPLAAPSSSLSSSSLYGAMERPSTPARESITATLNRANEMERHKSRDAILHELQDWRLDASRASMVGVVAMEEPSDPIEDIISPSTSPMKRPPSSSGRSEKKKKPATPAAAAAAPRNIREAFVDSSTANGRAKPAAEPSMPFLRRPSSSSSSAPHLVVAVPTSSSRNVDILILDDGPQHNDDDDDDDQRPCSPRKTSRGVFTTSTGGDWNLDEIAPKLDLECTASFLQQSSRRKTRGEEEKDEKDGEHDGGGDSSTSSGSDTEDMRSMARHLKQRKPLTKPPKHAKHKGFFNVAESLHAIDRWREQMDQDVSTTTTAQRGAKSTRSRASPPAQEPTALSSATASPQLGLACHTTDDQIVQWIKEKHSTVAEIKTRDGFRRFFRGIDEPRLARILTKAIADPEKVRRRLQLMQGHYSGQIQ